MKELLQYILEEICGSKDFEITETESTETESSVKTAPGKYINFTVKAKPENIGLIIGKNGKTIRAIRNILRVRATLEKSGVSLTVVEA